MVELGLSSGGLDGVSDFVVFAWHFFEIIVGSGGLKSSVEVESWGHSQESGVGEIDDGSGFDDVLSSKGLRCFIPVVYEVWKIISFPLIGHILIKLKDRNYIN